MEWVRHHDRYEAPARAGESDPISAFRQKAAAAR